MHPNQNLPPHPGSRSTVLIVDDNEQARMRVSTVLERAGYSAIQARDGQAALKTLTTTANIDAILLDLVMPWSWDFRSFQLGDRRLVQIPTLVTSPRPLSPHERYTLRLGVALIVHKPFADAELLASLGRILAEPGSQMPARDLRWRSRDGQPLMWSKHGRVACEAHAPSPGSEDWHNEGWEWIPRFAGKNKIEYTCQECCGGPIAHIRTTPPQAHATSGNGPATSPRSVSGAFAEYRSPTARQQEST
jgi:CheY-like chemotaxis protein